MKERNHSLMVKAN